MAEDGDVHVMVANMQEAADRPTSTVYSLLFLGLGVLLVFILQAVDATRKARAQAVPGRRKMWSKEGRAEEQAALKPKGTKQI